MRNFVDWALAYLKKRQLIVERKAGAKVEYVFKHALAQETIYESILQKTRKELHLVVAQAIESLFGDRLPEFYGMLSYHFSRAERPRWKGSAVRNGTSEGRHAAMTVLSSRVSTALLAPELPAGVDHGIQ